MEGISDPYSYLVNTLASNIHALISGTCSLITVDDIKLLIEEPPKREYGDLSLPLPRIAKLCGVALNEFSNLLQEGLRNVLRNQFLSDVKIYGSYLNVFINEVKYAEIVSNCVRTYGKDYGYVRDDKPLNIVVEFVSANPVHPLHIGSGRNAVLGDFIARVFEVRGHRVQRRYYVNDLGRQVATLVYGYIKLGTPEIPENVKPDEWFGFIYAVTNTVIDIIRLKRELDKLRNSSTSDDYHSKQLELAELIGILAELKSRNEDVVNKLIDSISRDSDPDRAVDELMRLYELRDPEVTKVFKLVVTQVLKGINETLRKLNISFDKWDWESELVTEGMVAKVIEIARGSKYFTLYKDAPALDFSDLQRDPYIRSLLKLPKSIEIPPLILMRSDGTTLYVTRDIAYTVKKFRESNADLVINVVGNEQTLAQAQLRLALYALGFVNEAARTLHYAYELVTLPGTKMSGRKGRYVSIDQVVNDLELRVEKVMKGRGSIINEYTRRAIATGAFKYVMLASSPLKVITFDAESALDLNRNSAPYLQYTYARTCGVLSKYGRELMWDSINYSAAKEGIKRHLLLLVGKFPYILTKTSKDLDPEILVTYLNKLADTFNYWYDSEPILHEPDEGIKQFKLFLTYSVGIVLRNGLHVLGIEALERI